MNKVSVVIINYNTFALTCNCIRSVIEHTKTISYEIVLVDNASTECNAADFLRQFPDINLIKSSRNGGFAYGNNIGIENASGNYILLLNSDTILLEDSISKTVEYASSQEDIGVVGCRMTYPDGGIQYSARKFRSISWELLDLFRFLLWVVPYRIRSQKMLGKYFRHDENIAADWVNGAYFLFPKKIIQQLPGTKLDDRFFMYGEDQLWCEKIRKLKYSIHFFSETAIIHINNGSTSLEKQLQLRKTMIKNELEIMRERKGKSLYYVIFKAVYLSKENVRNFIKAIIFKSTGRLIR